jgi:antitoxin component of RelBE/YafQ-DinJ toxin-antitoxin module
MSILKKNMKKKETTTVITARIPTELYSKFKNYCIQYGLSINEALKLLVENEINSIQNVYKNEEENAITSEEENAPKKKEPYSSGIDWDAIVEEPYEPDAHKFEYVTTTDSEGNEQTIRVMKSEYMFNLAPDTSTKEEPEIDPDDPIEKAIREQEEEWNKKWGE